MYRRSTRRRLRLPLGAAAVGLGVLCATAAVALAAHPVEGAKYKGQMQNNPLNTQISFRVSKDGSEVRHLKTKPDPIFPTAGCTDATPNVEQQSDPAHISRKGKFKGVIHYTYSNDARAKAVVKGRFRPNGRESGKVTATFPTNTDCNGTAPYSTNAQ
jgi:hypothetical protein